MVGTSPMRRPLRRISAQTECICSGVSTIRIDGESECGRTSKRSSPQVFYADYD